MVKKEGFPNPARKERRNPVYIGSPPYAKKCGFHCVKERRAIDEEILFSSG